MRRKKFVLIVQMIICAFLFISLNSCDKKLQGFVSYDKDSILRTLVECNCCNENSSLMLFISEFDTFYLCKSIQDTQIIRRRKDSPDILLVPDTVVKTIKAAFMQCNGPECGEILCSPFLIGQKYEFTADVDLILP